MPRQYRVTNRPRGLIELKAKVPWLNHTANPGLAGDGAMGFQDKTPA